MAGAVACGYLIINIGVACLVANHAGKVYGMTLPQYRIQVRYQ